VFSIFEYLRRRVCDSMVAGAYDAIEAMQNQPIAQGQEIECRKSPSPADADASPPCVKKIAPAPPTPPDRSPNQPSDLFTPLLENTKEPPLPSRKRGRPRKNPPPPPSLP
jgi:hypothetical protein